MAKNPVFSQNVRREQNLFEDLVIECLKIYGQDVYYMPRKTLTVDKILREDVESIFKNAYVIEMYIETTEGFGGDGTLFSKFGIEMRDQATFVVAKKRWDKQIGTWKSGNLNIRPAEGDLIYIPLTRSMFEVRFVQHESPFYQLGKINVYKLQCELFEYGQEKIQTGVPAIDLAQKDSAYTIPLVIVYTDPNTYFRLNERIYQVNPLDGMKVYGRVSSIVDIDSDKIMYVMEITSEDNTVRNFASGIQVIGEDSGVTAAVSKIYDYNDAKNLTFKNEPIGQNYDLNKKGVEIMDFSESNPFGDPRI